MEKILPLIESVTTAREMVPSDLTRGYDGYVFPGPLTVNEVGQDGYVNMAYAAAVEACASTQAYRSVLGVLAALRMLRVFLALAAYFFTRSDHVPLFMSLHTHGGRTSCETSYILLRMLFPRRPNLSGCLAIAL